MKNNKTGLNILPNLNNGKTVNFFTCEIYTYFLLGNHNMIFHTILIVIWISISYHTLSAIKTNSLAQQ